MRDKAHGLSECIRFEDGMFYLENERIWSSMKKYVLTSNHHKL